MLSEGLAASSKRALVHGKNRSELHLQGSDSLPRPST